MHALTNTQTKSQRQNTCRDPGVSRTANNIPRQKRAKQVNTMQSFKCSSVVMQRTTNLQAYWWLEFGHTCTFWSLEVQQHLDWMKVVVSVWTSAMLSLTHCSIAMLQRYGAATIPWKIWNPVPRSCVSSYYWKRWRELRKWSFVVVRTKQLPGLHCSF